MATVWTKEQQQVIDSRGSNLLVAAAAGSGKTAVLIERIISMVTDSENPIELDSILGVTFTNAAAREMKERIGIAINKELERDPDNAHLNRQAVLLNRARIMTLHSFCLDVIRTDFHCIGLDAGFRVADTAEIDILRKEALDEAMDMAYEEAEEDVIDFIERFSKGKDDSNIISIINYANRFFSSLPDYKMWIDDAVEELSAVEADSTQVFSTTIYNRFAARIYDYIDCAILMQEEAFNIIRRIDEESKLFAGIANDLTVLRTLRSLEGQELLDGISTFAFQRLAGGKKYLDDDALQIEDGKAKRNMAKSFINSAQKLCSGVDFKSISEVSHVNAKSLLAIKKLNEYFEQILTAKKIKRSLLDFSDIERYALQILTERDEDGNFIPSQTALRMRELFSEIFVDEYQDINEVQELIIESIASKDPRNRFMVGDVKQSIYRFRQASPEIFMDKYDTYTEDGEDRKILLHKNFRSRKNILDSINYIFKLIMMPSTGEIDYNDEEMLYLGTKFEENSITAGNRYDTDIYILDHKGIRGDLDETEDEVESTDLEAKLTAFIVRRLTDEKDGFYVWDKNINTYRIAQKKDIVILLRSVSNTASIYEEALRGEGIDVFSDFASGFFQTEEVATIVALLKVVDNPINDIPLISMMRSPIFGFDEVDLAMIRASSRKEDFYFAIRDFLDSYEAGEIEPVGNIDINDLSIRLKKFIDKIHLWREKSGIMPIDEFIWYLYSDTGYYSYVSGLPNSTTARLNLKVLFDRARAFENTSLKGLFNFISYVDKMKSSGSDYGEAKQLGENADVVRIMSIHKSKGLEFPIVIVGKCAKAFNMMDIRSSYAMDKDYGMAFDHRDLDRRTRTTSLYLETIRDVIKEKTIAEEMRLLYVAMSRAKEKLIFTGTSNIEGVRKLLTVPGEDMRFNTFDVIECNSYLKWILKAVLCHNKAEIKCSDDVYDSEASEFRVVDDESLWRLRFVTTLDEYRELVDEGTSNTKETSITEDTSNAEAGKDESLQNNAVGEITQAELELLKEKASRLESGERLKALMEMVMSRRGIDGIDESDIIAGAEKIDSLLEDSYPYRDIINLPSSISVTEIKKAMQAQREDDLVEVEAGLFDTEATPISLQESQPEINDENDERFDISRLTDRKSTSPAHRGTIMHLVMQLIDYSRIKSPLEINLQLDEMVEDAIITSRDRELVDENKIYAFFESELGQRVLESDFVAREKQIHRLLEPSQIYKDITCFGDERIMMRGIVDLYFEENGEIVLVDYKTDSVRGHRLSEIAERYRLQLDLYAQTLEMITGKRVKEKYLYLFAIDKPYRL